ncbi:MAG: hypothetical protein Q9160_007304 [Pyrenula sp. 1 TL-2023]
MNSVVTSSAPPPPEARNPHPASASPPETRNPHPASASPPEPKPSSRPVSDEAKYTTLHSPRLLLTHLRTDCYAHAEFICRLFNAPFSLAFNGSNAGVNTPSDAAERIKIYDVQRSTVGLGTFAVYLKSELPMDGGAKSEEQGLDIDKARPIGSVNIVIGSHVKYPDVGFNFLEEYTGKGYASEAVRTVIDWAMGESVGYGGVLSLTHPDNGPARALIKRVGMVERGTRGIKVYGTERAAVVYAMAGMTGELEEWGVHEEVELR